MLDMPITADFPGLPEGHLTKQLGAGAKRALENKRWRDLHGHRIDYQFTEATLPYKRAIAFHAKCAYRQASLRGHVPASFDARLVDHEYWSVQGTRQKVENYLESMEGVGAAEECSPDDSPHAAASPASSEHALSEEHYFSTPREEQMTPDSEATQHTSSPLPGLASPTNSGLQRLFDSPETADSAMGEESHGGQSSPKGHFSERNQDEKEEVYATGHSSGLKELGAVH
ncbi:g9519 [Coccomyxa elongata]